MFEIKDYDGNKIGRDLDENERCYCAMFVPRDCDLAYKHENIPENMTRVDICEVLNERKEILRLHNIKGPFQ
jgi:hypothetical protein